MEVPLMEEYRPLFQHDRTLTPDMEREREREREGKKKEKVRNRNSVLPVV